MPLFLVSLLWSCSLLVVCPAAAQLRADEVPYDQWIRDLSARVDLRSEKYLAIHAALKAMDSTTVCEVMARLCAKASGSNHRLRIRLREINFPNNYKWYHPDHCPEVRIREEDLLEALSLAYELEDEILIFQLYKDLVSYYTEHARSSEANLYGMLAKELYEKHGPDKIYSMSGVLHNLSLNLYVAREYRAVIDVLHKLHRLGDSTYLTPDDTVAIEFRMFEFNTLGLAYQKLQIPDSAFMAFRQALDIANTKQYEFWKGLIKGNMGDVFYQMEQYDSAYALLQYDYRTSLKAKEFDNAANSLQWLARMDVHVHRQPREALRKAREAKSLLQQQYKAEYMANTLLAFTKIFASLGQTDSMNYYQDRFLTLHDSIQQEITNARVGNVLLRLKGMENIHTINTLNKAKKRVALIRNFSLVCLVLVFVMGLMILNRQKLKLNLRRLEALEAKRVAEADAQHAKAQLFQFTQHLIEKNAIVESLEAQLRTRTLSEEQKNDISELSRQTILTEADWEHFKKLFEKVYPAFFYRLKQKAPDLTAADQRMAALSKLQVSNKEAAAMLGIAHNSVIKAKQRLRHRLDLEPDANLEAYFAQSNEFA